MCVGDSIRSDASLWKLIGDGPNKLDDSINRWVKDYLVWNGAAATETRVTEIDLARIVPATWTGSNSIELH